MDFPCSEFESLELLLEAPEVPDDELAVSGGGGELVGPVLVAGHDLDGAAEYNSTFPFRILISIFGAFYFTK